MRTAVSAEGALPVLMPFVINEDCKKTMYLEIQNISGSNVRASIKTLFSDGSYATENYMGTLDGEEIILTEDTISGTFSGEFSGFCVFKKV